MPSYKRTANEPSLGSLARKKFTSKDFSEKLKEKTAPKDDEWEDITDDSDSDWETVEDEPIKDISSITVKEEPSKLRQLFDFATTPLSGDFFQRKAKEAADIQIPEREEFFKATGKGDLEDWLAWSAATARGAGRGVIEGFGSAIDKFTSPADLAALAFSGGALSAGRAGLPTIANALRRATQASSIPVIGHGLETTFDPEADFATRALGAAETAGGIAGLHFPESALPKPPRKRISVPAGVREIPTETSIPLAKEAVEEIPLREVPEEFRDRYEVIDEEPLIDPNLNQGIGDPELAGSIPYQPKPETEDIVDQLFPGLKTREPKRRLNLGIQERVGNFLGDESGELNIDALFSKYQRMKAQRDAVRIPDEVLPAEETLPTRIQEPEIVEDIPLAQLRPTGEDVAKMELDLFKGTNKAPTSRFRRLLSDETGAIGPRKPSENREALFGRGDLDALTNEMVVMGRDRAPDVEYRSLLPENLKYELAPGETWRQRISNLIKARREAITNFMSDETGELNLEGLFNRPKPKEKLATEYGFDWEDFHEDGSPERMFHVMEGPELGSTLSETTLRGRGIDVPESNVNMPHDIRPDMMQVDEPVMGGTSPRFVDRVRDFLGDETGEINFGSSNTERRPFPLPRGAEDLNPNIPIRERPQQKFDEPSKLRQAWDVPLGMMSVDLPFMTSAAFRQASPLAWTSNWFKSWAKSARAFGSQEAFDVIENEIKNSKYFKPRYKPVVDSKGNIKAYKEMPSIAEETGVRMSDFKHITNREETLRSQLAEKIPLWGRYVRASNRGYAAFLNSLRKSHFEQLMDQADWAGVSSDQSKAKQIAEFINNATGRGSLKVQVPGAELNLENSAESLAAALWSPRLLASRIKFLNPMTYINAEPGVRGEYIKGLFRSVGTWWGLAGLASMAGAQVNMDPTNADFGKIRIGNTRIDPGAGFQQLLVFGSRMGTGEFTSSTTGKTTQMGEGYKPRTRKTTAEEFAASKLHPMARLAYDLMNIQKDRPVHLNDRAVQMVLPMMTQDIMEVMREDPELGTAMAPLSSIGFGTATYGKGSFNDPVFTDAIEEFIGSEPRSLAGTIRKF